MKRLGITSDEAMKQTAAGSKEAYDYLVAKGTSSARELAAGFKKAAEEAISANNGIAPSWVEAEVAARGYELQVDSAGKTTVSAMRSGQQAVDGLRNGLDKASKSAEELMSWQDRMDKRNAEVRSSMFTDKEGFSSDEKGNRVTMGGDLTTLTGIASFLKAAGVDDDKAARDIAREFADAKGDIPYFSNPGQMKYGGASSTMSQALLKAAERYTFGSGSPVGSTVGEPRKTTIPEPSRNVTVNLTLNNQSYGEVVTDEHGEESLRRLIDALQTAAGRSY
jgi:hypothetical protein